MFAFMHRFVPSASNMSAPLHEMRKEKTSKKAGQMFKILHLTNVKRPLLKYLL